MLSNIVKVDVVQASMKITGAGDGLSAAVNISPADYVHGETLYVLLECEVVNVDFPEVKKDTGVYARRHTLRTVLGTILDPEVANTYVAEQRRRNLEAAGIHELPMEEDDL